MSVLPISAEASVFAATISACDVVLGDVRLGLALLYGGVLHFVTDRPSLHASTWELIVLALTDPDLQPQADGIEEAVLPLVVQRRPTGVLIAQRPGLPFTPAEAALLRLMALRVSAAAENGRLHANLSELLAEYMSPDVADALLADPEGSRLGGQTRDVSVLFADLTGFTAFSEQTSPEAVVALLNRFYAAAVPAIVEHGGTVSAFIGDALMGLFGAPRRQPEHPLLAARAALALRDATSAIHEESPGLPRFRIGVNTGLATVGNVGSPGRRVFTAIGDTVNVASRLEGIAAPGSIVIGPETYATIRSFAEARVLPPVVVKGRAAPIGAYELLALRTGSDQLLGAHTVSIDLTSIRPPR